MQTKAKKPEWAGVYAAIPTFFTEDGEVDDSAMSRFMDWLCSHDSIDGVVAHAHGGEVAALTVEEMTRASASAVKAANGRVTVIGGLLAEGVRPALDITNRLEAVGVDGFLVMPPHHWLRHGKSLEESEAYFRGVSEGTNTALIVHEYPATTKAGYSSDELVAFSKLDRIVAVKSGSRNMAVYLGHVSRLRAEAPQMAILSCHDEAMLPTLAPGVDGVLVTLASLIPDELAAMLAAVAGNDLHEAQRVAERVRPLTELFYGSGNPTPRSHALLKGALFRLGVVPNTVVRPPIPPITDAELAAIDAALQASGLTERHLGKA